MELCLKKLSYSHHMCSSHSETTGKSKLRLEISSSKSAPQLLYWAKQAESYANHRATMLELVDKFLQKWQELLHPPPRQTYSMDMEYSFVWKPTEMGSPRDGWTRDEELDVTDKGMPKVMPGCFVTGIFWQEVTGRILPME
ncbi:hypothetical protein TURU_144074 [Turdus rufiventris]|nr:hypothetical protein TURU_144074 [Turdus rufiventris]